MYLLSTIYSPDRQVIDVDADELPSNPGPTNTTPSASLLPPSATPLLPPRSPSVTSSVTHRAVAPTPLNQSASPIIPPSISVAVVQQVSMSPAPSAPEPASTFPDGPLHVIATPSHSPQTSPTASHFDLSRIPHPHSFQPTISKPPKKKKKINVLGVLETVQGKIDSSMTPPATTATTVTDGISAGKVSEGPDSGPMLSASRQVSGEPPKSGATEAIKHAATEQTPLQPNPVPLAPISEIWPRPITVVVSREQSTTSAEPVPERQITSGSSSRDDIMNESTADRLLGLVHEHAMENNVSQLSRNKASPFLLC
ncbi:hypothetical protein MPER_10575 [Moniliophthora perniciosa FA553]|nr:hypothetical protein MPER_10575 [Moniliophthora perniciosa FA553]